ncbi:MAG TPA: TPM domain-containing protein [Gallionellaceae bacterium]|nr:TPM domain-containing protein [Gallionellaceae bacterium]
MNKWTRFFRHLAATRWQVARCFPARSMHAIRDAIRASESGHMGELRLAVEAGLDPARILAGASSRQRALEVFAQLGIWDTEHNSGVLIYLLLADRKVEIVADRGIHARVGDAGWAAICREMESRFRAEKFEEGVLHGIHAITVLLQQHFPAHPHKPNELPDQPIVL